MSSRNDDGTVAIALAIGVLAAMGYVIFLAAAFLTFVVTIISVFAWNRPVRMGKFVLTPDDARGFIRRGLAGAFLVPAFLAFIDLFLGVRMNWDYVLYFAGAGYMGGSLGIAIILAEEEGPEHAIYVPPQQAISQPERKALPPAEREPFHFATWDDEERGS